jgi:spermidine synthase
MKPWKTLAKAPAPDGGELVLQERDGVFVIRVGGHELMSSRMHGSEEAMAERACAPLASTRSPRVLIGGLGLGYTLRAALDRLPPGAEVTVAELSPAVVEWNRGPLAPLAGAPLTDARVRVVEADVRDVMRGPATRFDAILLDVDNGPSALTASSNQALYAEAGLALVKGALKPDGVVVVWSAAPDEAFTRRLERQGFTVEVLTVSARGTSRGAKHTLFVARPGGDPLRSRRPRSR